jgi:hypothetical protein
MSRDPVVAVSRVSGDFIARVCERQGTSFKPVGTFDLMFLQEMIDILSEDTSGEIKLLYIPAESNKTGGAMLVAKYDGQNYVALAGIRTENVESGV